MKVLGIILLLIGIFSLIGGLVSSSGADTLVVILGYVLKFSLIIGGIALFSMSKKKNSKD